MTSTLRSGSNERTSGTLVPAIAVIGTGALGGYYGARLAQSGLDVHFLCHRNGAAIREKGLVVQSVGRSIMNIRASAFDRPEDMPRCDVVIVALKTTANYLLSSLLPPVIKPDGIALVMQNGLDVERDAARAVPGHQIFGGLSFLCANTVEPGYVQHLDYGNVLLGWFDETGNPQTAARWMVALNAMFNEAFISTEIAPDLRLARWKKLVWNIPYNGLSVVHRATTDALMKNPGQRRLVETLMREVQALARACGCQIEDEFIHKMLTDTVKMKPYKTSMLLDFEAGKPLEIEAMYERPLLAGEKSGAYAPNVRALLDSLKKLDVTKRS
jgi:2-dehydropantoate 2-reductase